MLRTSLLLLALVAPASAQFGRRNIQRDKPQQQGGGAKDMNDVDLAMAGWEQLSKNPGKMQEVMESLKDPEVMATAQQMGVEGLAELGAAAAYPNVKAPGQGGGSPG